MSKYLKVTAVLAVLIIAYAVYFYYPIYVGQARFHDIQSEVEIGMKREQVLALAKSIGYFEYESGQELIEQDGHKANVNIDSFSYANFLLPSVVIIEYDRNDIVKNIVVDQ